jgi:hypothetical protein
MLTYQFVGLAEFDCVLSVDRMGRLGIDDKTVYHLPKCLSVAFEGHIYLVFVFIECMEELQG